MVNRIIARINDRYGSKRALARQMKYSTLGHIGLFNRYRSIDWQRVQRLVFVCKGNICRSPLGRFWSEANGVTSESFGLDCGDGHPADPRAISYADKLGIDLRAHRTRPITRYMPAAGDLVVAMEPYQASELQHSVGQAQLTLAGLWLSRPTPYIADPYSAGPRYFERCEGLIIESSGALIRAINGASSREAECQ